MNDDLVAFIRARLDEDERIAREAGGDEWIQGEKTVDWDDETDDEITAPSGYIMRGDDDAVVYDEGTPSPKQATHIARFDPARVLRGVDAKRRIVASCEPDHYDSVGSGDDTTALATEVLWGIASEWSTHSHYLQEWTP